MKYLVNRETKEHVILDHSIMEACPPWEIVEADDEGWIIGDFPTCPLPEDALCEVMTSMDILREIKETLPACQWVWGLDRGSPLRIVAYRPILPAESKPTLEETWHAIKRDSKVDVFTRLSAAVAASESIPALIAEINAMLPDGYEVTRK